MPLGDLFENRRLALLALCGAVLGTLGIAFSQGPAEFLVASVLTGFCSTGAQVLLPLATHLTPPRRQGVVIGQVLSGLLTGIMLARPAASFLTAALGWRAIFYVSTAATTLIGIALFFACPSRRPEAELGFGEVIGSVFRQFRRHRPLQLRSLDQALLLRAGQPDHRPAHRLRSLRRGSRADQLRLHDQHVHRRLGGLADRYRDLRERRLGRLGAGRR